MSRPIGIVDLGHRPYAPVLELQRALCRARGAGELKEDLLLLVEHDPVITLGRSTKATSLPIAPSDLTNHGVELFEVERGGDVTFHGPGQLVGYPIVDLQQMKPDLHWYLRELEGALIDALATLQIPAQRSPGQTGVWVGPRKIASIGVHVKKWVTLHGFALNVTTDLKYFDLIVPCGIEGVEMTSVEKELEGAGRSREEPWMRTQEAVITAFARRFARDPHRLAASDLAGNISELAAFTSA